MIWERIPSADSFRASYEAFSLALEGAIGVAVDALKRRNPRLSINQGNAAVAKVRSMRADMVYHARMAIAEAMTAGSSDGEGRTDPSEQSRYASMVESIVSSMASIDENRAFLVIRNQALTYDIAYRTANHQIALAKAIGDLGNDPFTQLDRANRRFKSVDLATGYVRLGAADAYLQSFAKAAHALSHSTAFLVRADEPDREVSLADLETLRADYFHPSTPYSLRLP